MLRLPQLSPANFKTSIICLTILTLLWGGCDLIEETSPEDHAASEVPAWITIYFTDPENPSAQNFRNGPDEKLAAAIRQAQTSIDMAIYDLNLWSIRDALIDANQRGVTVRLVIESDNLDEPEIQDLIKVGIPTLGDRREGLMHHKFVVLDHQEVWTGSMNFTTIDTYLNNNHLVRIRSAHLAESYTQEFEEMFSDDLFGPQVRADTPYPVVTVDNTRLEVFFSPDDKTLEHLVQLVASAQESIYFMAFSFTSDELASAMLERAGEGVLVQGIFEEAQYYSNIGSEYDRFRTAGLDVRLDGNPKNMHHKVIIVDESIVVLGSYNFSNSAETWNDENTLIVYNPSIAMQFVDEFDQLFTAGHR